jgi:gluconate 5-dehydrogenase
MSKLFDLTGRIALITGSSRGIGRAIAEGYVEAGARVVVNGRDAKAVAETVKALGPNAVAAPFDVTSRTVVEAAIGTIESDVGPIDILVNNAGMTKRMAFTEFPEEDWRQIMATNLDSVFFVTQSVARRMVPRARGKIVNICSVMSELGRASIAPYTASKGAVKMLTKTMCAEWAKHGITANGISPGYFGTELNSALMADEKFSAWVCARTPAARWGKVEELQGAAIFLASDASSFVNGHILFVDGGMTAVV